MSPQGGLPSIVHRRNCHSNTCGYLQVGNISSAEDRPQLTAVFRYYHRCLNIPKLVNVHFVGVPSNMTLARMIRLHRVPERPHLLSQGLREMEEKDVPEITDLYARYMKRFGTAIVMTQDDVRHHFLSGRGEGPGEKDSWKNPRQGQVVWTYVIEVSSLPSNNSARAPSIR